MTGRMVECTRDGCKRRARVIGDTTFTCRPEDDCPWTPRGARKFGQPKQKGGKKK